jgi:hypothetical protein
MKRIDGPGAIPVAHEVEVVHDLGLQNVNDPCTRGDPVAREDLLGGSGTAYEVPALQNKHVQACLRQIGGCNESVVTGSNHDGVVRVPIHRVLLSGAA